MLLQALAGRGHRCAAVTREDFGELRRRGVPAGDAEHVALRHEGIEVHAAPNRYRQAVLLTEVVRAFEPDLTIVSEEGCILLEAALEADASPVVCVSHSAQDLPFGPESRVPNPLKCGMLRQVAALVTVSRYMRDYIRRWGDLDARALYFPAYGTQLPPRRASFERGFVTLINPCAYKGISIFLELARSMPETDFAAVPTWGTTDEDRSALGRLPNVRLLNPSERIDEIFALTRVLLVPSLGGEAFGQIVVEAMLRGIPVLASDVGGLPEAKLGVDYVLPVRRIVPQAGDDEMRFRPLVPPQDTGGWVEALRRLLSDRELYERVSRDSREAAAAFVSDAGVEKFEEFFETLARPRPAKGREDKVAQDNHLLECLNSLSPEKRALLARRLKERAQPAARGGAAPEAERATHADRTASTPTPLVNLQPEGDGTPFFCVHPVGGNVICYVELARALGSARPFFALQAQGLEDGQQPFARVEEMAAHYVNAVRAAQPRGPYLLGGWSFGGTVAFEMAQQLRKKGERVALLVLIDSRPPRPDAARADGEDASARTLFSFLSDLRGLHGASFQVSYDELRGLSGDEQLEHIVRLAISAKIFPGDAGGEQVQRLLRVFTANVRAGGEYAPQPYGGGAALFTSGMGSGGWQSNGDDPSAEWGRLLEGPFAVRAVPGDHYTVLTQPGVAALAAELGRLLEGAGADTPRGGGGV
ncbi:MAG TPA: thioesterase domain-containing protein [Pyrinomonadaceae bacterium]|nr:thioesterase domain-containing protein [Pyrinomonadaceae bacterium]